MLQITTSHQREHIFGLSHRTRRCSPFSYSAPWGEEIVAVRLSPTGANAIVVCGVATRQLAVLPNPDGARLRVVKPPSLGGDARTQLFDDDTAAQRELDGAASRLADAMRTLQAHSGSSEAALRLPSPPLSRSGDVLASGGVEGEAADVTDMAEAVEKQNGVDALPIAIAEAMQAIDTASQRLKHRHERQTCKVSLGAGPRFLQARLCPSPSIAERRRGLEPLPSFLPALA
jgi:hypothetical protein